jgi:ATP/maltotriose-dependent transcriptional regulator MalT
MGVQAVLDSSDSYYEFWYCELLLDVGEAAANGRMSDVSTSWPGAAGGAASQHTALALFGEAHERARESMQVAEGLGWIIDVALDNLTLGRSALLTAICRESDDLAEAGRCIDVALAGLQQAGQKHYLARGFLGRAALRRYRGDLDGAETDAGEALEIAQSCNMLPFEVDAMIEKCSLELVRKTEGFRERAMECLRKARSVMTDKGYWRRLVQVKILETVLEPGGLSSNSPPLALRCLERPT